MRNLVLHYQEYGNESAPLMLFIHGGGVGGWMWDAQIQFFTHYHCIVPDLPEHGASNQQNEFTIQGSAEELIRLIEEKAKEKKVVLIGFSLGSQVIIQILSMRPDLIDFAIINSALARPILSARILIPTAIKLAFPLINKRWFSKLQAKPLYINGDYFEKYYEDSRQMKPETLIRVFEENLQFQIPKGFGKSEGKILVTVGEKENAVMRKSAKDIVEANANCKGIIIPGLGHGLPLALPAFFNLMVDNWLCEDSLPKDCKVIR